MKRVLALALAAPFLAGCGSEMADERGIFKTDAFAINKDRYRMLYVSGAPNAQLAGSYEIDADETPISIDDYKGDVQLDCRVQRRRDPVKNNPMDPDITDCKRVER